ncbi:hypothetical protein WEI85_19865 [Actinomycetes bacterium KLBMP 9797]
MTMLDLRHLDDIALLTTTTRHAGRELAHATGQPDLTLRRAYAVSGPRWVIGHPTGARSHDTVHWLLLADPEHTITVPVPVTRITEPRTAPLPWDDWRERHRLCRTCDWHWEPSHRQLLPEAWQRRTEALLPMARDGDQFIRAVRDNLDTALRLHAAGRVHEAAYWLRVAEHAAGHGDR